MRKLLLSLLLGSGLLSAQTYTVGASTVNAYTLVQLNAASLAGPLTNGGTLAGVALNSALPAQNVNVTMNGVVFCTFENNTTPGDLVILGLVTYNYCRDSGQTAPSGIAAGVRVLGQVLQAVSAGSYATVVLGRPDAYGQTQNSFGGATLVTSVGSPGSNTNVPTEAAVRSAIAGGGGTAGGDLSGSFPNPVVAKINGATVPINQPCASTNSSGQFASSTCGSNTVFGSDPAFATINAALANANSQAVNIVVYGDSISRCYVGLCAVGPSTAAGRWVDIIGSQLKAAYGSHGTGIMLPVYSVGVATLDPAWTASGAAWSYSSIIGPKQLDATAAPGSGLIQMPNTTALAVSAQTGDHVNVYCAENTDTASGIQVKIDSTVAGTACGATQGSPTAEVFTFATTLGSHTLTLTSLGNNAYLYGVEWTIGSTGVSIHNVSEGSAASAFFGATPSSDLAFTDLIPGGHQLDITFLGTNDQGNTYTTSTFQTNLNNLVTHELGLASKPSILVANEPPSNIANIPNYWIYSQIVAANNSAAYVSVPDVWGSYAQANTAGYFGGDGIHPNTAGHVAIANVLRSRLKATANVNGGSLGSLFGKTFFSTPNTGNLEVNTSDAAGTNIAGLSVSTPQAKWTMYTLAAGNGAGFAQNWVLSNQGGGNRIVVDPYGNTGIGGAITASTIDYSFGTARIPGSFFSATAVSPSTPSVGAGNTTYAVVSNALQYNAFLGAQTNDSSHNGIAGLDITTNAGFWNLYSLNTQALFNFAGSLVFGNGSNRMVLDSGGNIGFGNAITSAAAGFPGSAMNLTSSGNLTVAEGVNVNKSQTAKPTCTSGLEGTIWYINGSGSTNGSLQTCQNQGGTYTWTTSAADRSVSVTDYGADPTGVADSTTAFNNALSSACPVNVVIPTGQYLITGQLTINCSGTNLLGNGPHNVFLNFNPASAATLIYMANSNSAIQMANNRVGGFTMYGMGSQVKTGINILDNEEVTIKDVGCSGNSSAAWHDSTNASVCLFTQGRQGLWIEGLTFNGDNPIVIGRNTRSSGIQIDIDESTFHNIYLIGASTKPCVTINDNTILSDVTFSGMQSYVTCSRAFSWVATTNAAVSRSLTIKDNPRWEQSTASDYFAYISMPSSGHLYGFEIDNWNEGSANAGGQGFYLRNVIGARIMHGNYEDTGTLLNTDSTVLDVILKGNTVQAGTTTPVATVAAGGAAGTGPTISVVGNSQAGQISLTTGTSTATGTLATVTFPSSYLVAPNCMVISNGYTTGNVLPTLGWIPTSGGVTLYTYVTAPTASTAYKINYTCERPY